MQVQYLLLMSRDQRDPRYARARLVKTWYSMADRASRRRAVAEAWVDCTGMGEAESLAAALSDVRAALLDELA